MIYHGTVVFVEKRFGGLLDHAGLPRSGLKPLFLVEGHGKMFNFFSYKILYYWQIQKGTNATRKSGCVKHA